MAKLVINSLEEFESFEGKELGTSDYHEITQEEINKFAEATIDPQWIHIDPERAAKESPFGTTIAHGYLTVSLLTHLYLNIVEVNNVKLMVNYGIEDLRFKEPVKVNHSVRIKITLKECRNLRGVIRAKMGVVMEIKDAKKPAYEGTIVFLYHFEK